MKSELLLSARTPQELQDGLREVLESTLVVRTERPDQLAHGRTCGRCWRRGGGGERGVIEQSVATALRGDSAAS